MNPFEREIINEHYNEYGRPGRKFTFDDAKIIVPVLIVLHLAFYGLAKMLE